MQCIPKRFQLDPVSQVEVLSPMNRALVGVSNLNTQLQACLNPKGQELARDGRTFREGDKVMQIKNNYDKEVFNGDIGRIIKLDLEVKEIKVCFDDRVVVYEYADLDELVLAIDVNNAKTRQRYTYLHGLYPSCCVPHCGRKVEVQAN